MILPYEMDDSQWEMLVRDTAEHFDDLTIKRGYAYYKQGRVRELALPDARYVEGKVEGGRLYRVEINLDFFTLSLCDCPYDGMCKHMIAVLLAFAERQGRPVHALANAGTAVLQQPAARTPGAVAQHRNAASPATAPEAELRSAAARIAGMDLAERRELFKRCTAHLEGHTPNTLYVQKALHAIGKIMPGLGGAADRILDLHARLFVLEQLLGRTASQTPYSLFVGYHTQVAVDELHADMIRRLEDGLPGVAGGSEREQLSQTLDVFRLGKLAKSPVQPYYSDYYDLLWACWLLPDAADGTGLLTRELDALRKAGAELGDALHREVWLQAQCRIELVLGDDDKAWELLREANEGSGGRFDYEAWLGLSNELAVDDEPARLAAWLLRLEPLMARYHRAAMNRYAALWEEAVRRDPELEQAMLDSLARLLPYSWSRYEDLLRERGEWRRWIDYQLLVGSDPLGYRVAELQPIEKEAPELLLPFYHQAVERCVLLKNRDGYKAAVKLLKRLAKLYRKLKREERWERFLETFAGRHSRLRALQEELRKGKLLS